MPPRYAYWTIIFDNQPTSFRTATQDELLPTFKQIQSKHPDAVMKWFSRGRLWNSEEEAREALLARREARGRGPGRDERGPRREERRPPSPEPGQQEPEQRAPRGPRPEWRDRGPRPEWR